MSSKSMQEKIKTFFHRTPYIQDGSSFVRDNHRTIQLSILFFLVVLFFRSWQNILNPGLYMEDATHYFNIYYGLDRRLDFILQHPNGYFNILNNFVAWFAAECDVRLQPLLYHLFSLAMGITVACCFIFTGILRNRMIILVAPLALGLSGMNHIYYYVSLTFQMYNVVVLLLCLLFFPVVRSYAGIVILCIVTTVLIWSGPYSVVALPTSIMLIALFQNKAKLILFVSVISNVLLYSLSVKESTIQLLNITDKGIRIAATKVLFERVFFLELLGQMTFLNVLILGIALLLAFYLLRKNTFYLKTSFVFFSIIICSLAPLFLSIKYPLYRTVFPCHIYISQFFWICFLLLTADRLIEKFQPKLFMQILAAAMFVCIVTVDNHKHPAKGEKKVMASIPEFVHTIHLVEKLNLKKDNQYVVIKTENVIPKYFPPMVKVGSNRQDAERLKRKDISIPSGKGFVVD